MNFPPELLKQCCFLAGPTAVGKTATSLALAEQLNAEILSLDSMAIYRHMDIGTAKPVLSEQTVIPHHLLDLIEPHQNFSMSEYCMAALNAAQDVVKRGRVPLFVGGTGLYLRAILRGIFDGPEADWDLRKKYQKTADEEGSEQLHRQLMAVDPEIARRLHVNDHRRIMRALEVHALTGVALSEQQNNDPLPAGDRPRMIFWLHPPRDWLRARIDRRVDLMMDVGLLQETTSLLEMDPAPGRTARQALGYRELIDHLETGVPLEECVELIRVRTRQFAKRQHTWFRNLKECRAIRIDGTESAEQLVNRIFQESTAT
jgi:tRNA dimethylallyltransferase